MVLALTTPRLFSQEDGSQEWHIVNHVGAIPGWADALPGALLTLVCCGLWRLLIPSVVASQVAAGIIGNVLPNWMTPATMSLAFWAGNHLVVRIAEWRAWSNVPVTLGLTVPSPDDHSA